MVGSKQYDDHNNNGGEDVYRKLEAKGGHFYEVFLIGIQRHSSTLTLFIYDMDSFLV